DGAGRGHVLRARPHGPHRSVPSSARASSRASLPSPLRPGAGDPTPALLDLTASGHDGSVGVPMKAIVQERFGTPDVLRLPEAEPPLPRPADVPVGGAPARRDPDH